MEGDEGSGRAWHPQSGTSRHVYEADQLSRPPAGQPPALPRVSTRDQSHYNPYPPQIYYTLTR